MDIDNIDRRLWSRALAALPAPEITEAVEPFQQQYTVTMRSLPRAGLGQLRLRDGALGDSFYLGEFPLASAHVELRDAAGERYEGGALLMADDENQAVGLAVCDAVLSNRLAGYAEIAALVKRGIVLLLQRQQVRNTMMLRSKVDFSLLETTEEQSEEEGDGAC